MPAVRKKCATGCSTVSTHFAPRAGYWAALPRSNQPAAKSSEFKPSRRPTSAGRRIELTEYARGLVPPLPFKDIDVLIIEQGGKDISGTTMDPNVTGRFWVNGLDDGESPRVTNIVLLGITDISAGNVLGIGFADFIPVSVAAGIDWHKTYVNCFTAGVAGVRRSRMPMVLPTPDDCIKAALSMCGRGPNEPKRVVRIRSTLHLDRCWVSDALLGEVPAGR